MLRLSIFSGIFLCLLMHSPAFAKSDLIVIPFEIKAKTIVIQGNVNGRPGNLIVDTGIPNMLLNKPYVESSSLFNNKEFGGVQSVTGSVENEGMSIVFLEIQDFSAKLGADVLDLKPIEKQKGMDIMGIVGLNMFRNYEFVIDFFLKEIYLYRLDRKGVRILKPRLLPSQTISFHYEGHLPCITAHLNGTSLQLGLDTGTEINILPAALFDKKSDQFTHIQTKKLMDLTGKQTAVLSAHVAGLQIGTLDMPSMNTLFIPQNKQYGGIGSKRVQGLLGIEFFQYFRLAINAKKRQVYLWDSKEIENVPVATERN